MIRRNRGRLGVLALLAAGLTTLATNAPARAATTLRGLAEADGNGGSNQQWTLG